MKVSLLSRTGVVAAAGAAVLAVSLTACSSNEEGSAGSSSQSESTAPSETTQSQSPIEVIAASADAAKEAGSAKIAIEAVTNAQGQEMTVSGEGAVNTETGAAQLTMELQGPDGPVTVEMVAVDGAVYMRGLPGQPEDAWVRTPMQQSGQAGLGMAAGDPSQALQLLRGAADDVAEAGTEEIRGVETTRYTGTIDIAKLLEQSEGGEQAEQAQQMLESLGAETIPFEVFLDEQGRPARLVQTIELGVGDQAVSTEVTLDMYDWGTDVQVTAPDPADVVDASEIQPTPAPTAS